MVSEPIQRRKNKTTNKDYEYMQKYVTIKYMPNSNKGIAACVAWRRHSFQGHNFWPWPVP